MSAMDRYAASQRALYGPAPTTPTEALAHVLAVHADLPDDELMVKATDGIYGDRVRTGLTMGDLRAIAAQLGVAATTATGSTA